MDSETGERNFFGGNLPRTNSSPVNREMANGKEKRNKKVKSLQ